MTLSITCRVVPGAQITRNAQGKWLITPEAVNLLGRPSVTAEISEQDLYPAATITINKVGSTTEVSVQMKLSNVNMEQRFRISMWMTEDASALNISSNEPTSPASGWVGNQATAITSSAGLYTATFTHDSSDPDGAGPTTWFVCVATATGFIAVSEAIVYA